MNGTGTSVFLVLSFVHRQEHWHPSSDSTKFAELCVQCSEVELGSGSVWFDRVSACPPSPIWTDVLGLGISLSLVNFDEPLRYVWCSIAVVGVRTPVQGLVDAGMEPVVEIYLDTAVDGILKIGVNREHYTGFFAYTNLAGTRCWHVAVYGLRLMVQLWGPCRTP